MISSVKVFGFGWNSSVKLLYFSCFFGIILSFEPVLCSECRTNSNGMRKTIDEAKVRSVKTVNCICMAHNSTNSERNVELRWMKSKYRQTIYHYIHKMLLITQNWVRSKATVHTSARHTVWHSVCYRIRHTFCKMYAPVYAFHTES